MAVAVEAAMVKVGNWEVEISIGMAIDVDEEEEDDATTTDDDDDNDDPPMARLPVMPG